MTDIAYRLRNHVKSRLPAQEPAMRNGAWDMMLEGADEIERLRAALIRVANCDAIGRTTDGMNEHVITLAYDTLGLNQQKMTND